MGEGGSRVRKKVKVIASVDYDELELEVNKFISLYKVKTVESIQFQTTEMPIEYVDPIEYSVLITYTLRKDGE